VKREGTSLVLDGRPFFFAGFNNYYMMTRSADSGTRKEVRNRHNALRRILKQPTSAATASGVEMDFYRYTVVACVPVPEVEITGRKGDAHIP